MQTTPFPHVAKAQEQARKELVERHPDLNIIFDKMMSSPVGIVFYCFVVMGLTVLFFSVLHYNP